MVFQTQRLEIIPLNLPFLRLLANNMREFESKLNCKYQAEPICGFFAQYVDMQINVVANNPDDYLFNTFWVIIEKESRIVVGTAAFKGNPDKNGEIEIGYGLGKKHEHKGYMTEAVAEMCRWAMSQENVKHVIAETDVDGYASQKILERNGFVRYRFGDSSWWRL